MKSPNSPDGPPRFNGQMRHYHRSGTPPQKSWDEWVDGKSARSGPPRNWFKIAGVTISLLALAGIITGLIVELS